MTTKILTPLARLSYPYLDNADDNGKYRCELIFEDGTDVTALNDAVQAAIEEQFGSKPPKGLVMPVRQGDVHREGKDGYEDALFISANTTFTPDLCKGVRVAGKVDYRPVEAGEIYAGCYVYANVTAKAWEHSENGMSRKGIKFYLNSVVKVRDGEPFGGAAFNPSESYSEIDPAAFGDETDSQF